MFNKKLLFLAILFFIWPTAVSAEDNLTSLEGYVATLTITDPEGFGVLLEEEIGFYYGESAFGVLMLSGIDVEYHTDWGLPFVTSIYGLNEETARLFDGWVAWMVYVNGVQSPAAASETLVSPEDVIEFKFIRNLGGRRDITHYFTCDYFRDFIIEQYASNPRGIADADIAGVRSLSLANSDVTSLNGINHFTGLTRLLAQNNLNLYALEIRDLDNLVNIVVQGSRIETLTLHNLQSLTHLNAARNGLTALNLTELDSLRNISASENLLYGDISLTNLPELRIIWLEDNNLDSLDVTGLEFLQMLDVRGNRINSPDDVEGWQSSGNLTLYPNSTPPTTSRLCWMRDRVADGYFAFYNQE